MRGLIRVAFCFFLLPMAAWQAVFRMSSSVRAVLSKWSYLKSQPKGFTLARDFHVLLVTGLILFAFQFTVNFNPAHAGVFVYNDTAPAGFANWDNGDNIVIGCTGNGSLTVDGIFYDDGTPVNEYWYELYSGISILGDQSGATGSATVTQGGYWSTSTLYVGNEGIGSLNIHSNGYVSSYTCYLGYGSNSTGTVTVNGSDFNFSAEELYIGYGGTGVLGVSNNGPTQIGTCYLGYTAGSEGTINLYGGDSRFYSGFFYIGKSGEGRVEIENGALFDNYLASSYLGCDSGSIGTVVVSDDGSEFRTNNIYVGDLGNGILSIISGGLGFCGNAHIGHASGSAGTVTVTGTDSGTGTASTWETNDLCVGNEGTGTLYITNGGVVNSIDSFIGYNNTGSVYLSGSTSEWNARFLYVGGYNAGSVECCGNGQLAVTRGSTVNCEFVTHIGNTAGSSGGVSVMLLSELHNNGFIVGNAGSVNNPAEGSLGVISGSTVTSGPTGTTYTHSYIGYQANSDGSVGIGSFPVHDDSGVPLPVYQGDGSSWENNGDLFVGYGGNGSLSVVNDSNMSNCDGYVGYAAGSVGEVQIGMEAFMYDVSNPYAPFPIQIPLPDGYAIESDSSRWDNDGNLTIGFAGTGYMSIRGGSIVTSDNGYIGSGGGVGTVVIGSVLYKGDYSFWDMGDGDLYITNGSLSLVGGGFVICDGIHLGPNGTIYVEKDAEIEDDKIASDSTGTLNINGGIWRLNHNRGFYNWASGTVNIGDESTILVTDGATITPQDHTVISGDQTLTITGSNSFWDSSSYHMYIDDGNLNIENGGSASCIDGRVGSGSGSTGIATVDGAGSNWTMSGTLRVGYDSGTGTLNITNGGLVSNTNGSIGDGVGSTGTVSVGEVGSTSENVATWTNSGALSVGNGGTGTLNILEQGKVSTSNLSIGTNGTLNLAGGILELTDDFTFTGWGSTWSGGTFNFSNGTVAISNAAEVTASVDTTLAANQKLLITGTDTEWNNGSLSMRVNDGELTVSDGGALISLNGYVGSGSGSTGVATLDNATWTINSYDLLVGDDDGSSGELNVLNGAILHNISNACIGTNAGSTGTVNVDNATWHSGVGSNVILVGYHGDGTLNIENSGVVTTGRSVIGYGSTATGSATVDGAGSLWTHTYLFYVGYNGTASMSITNGGEVFCNSTSFIGDMSGSHGTASVDGEGSTWTTNGAFYVGCSGSGSLTISDGGVVNSSSSILARYSGATGIVTVTGDGSEWTHSGSLNVGYSGNGTVNIFDGGFVSVGGTLNIGYSDEVCMKTGGKLALYGDADDSLAQFLALVTGTDRIQWYDDVDARWELLSTATLNTDYWLNYISDTSSDLYGYTVLQVGVVAQGMSLLLPSDFEYDNNAAVPEPGTVALLFTGLVAVGFVSMRKRGGKERR